MRQGEGDDETALLEALRLESEGDVEGAQRIFEALVGDAGQQNPDVLAAYGLFKQNALGDHDAAEQMYQLSLQIAPAHMNTLQNYAIFLEEVRQDYDMAEQMYNRALESTSLAALPFDAAATPGPVLMNASSAASPAPTFPQTAFSHPVVRPHVPPAPRATATSKPDRRVTPGSKKAAEARRPNGGLEAKTRSRNVIMDKPRGQHKQEHHLKPPPPLQPPAATIALSGPEMQALLALLEEHGQQGETQVLNRFLEANGGLLGDKENSSMVGGGVRQSAGGGGGRAIAEEQPQQHKPVVSRKVDADIRFMHGSMVVDHQDASDVARHTKEHHKASLHSKPWLGVMDPAPKPNKTPKPSHLQANVNKPPEARPPKSARQGKQGLLDAQRDGGEAWAQGSGMTRSTVPEVVDPTNSWSRSGVFGASDASSLARPPLGDSSGPLVAWSTPAASHASSTPSSAAQRPRAAQKAPGGATPSHNASKCAARNEDARYDPKVRMGLRKAHSVLCDKSRAGKGRISAEDLKVLLGSHGVPISLDSARRMHQKLANKRWGAYDEFLEQGLDAATAGASEGGGGRRSGGDLSTSVMTTTAPSSEAKALSRVAKWAESSGSQKGREEWNVLCDMVGQGTDGEQDEDSGDEMMMEGGPDGEAVNALAVHATADASGGVPPSGHVRTHHLAWQPQGASSTPSGGVPSMVSAAAAHHLHHQHHHPAASRSPLMSRAAILGRQMGGDGAPAAALPPSWTSASGSPDDGSRHEASEEEEVSAPRAIMGAPLGGFATGHGEEADVQHGGMSASVHPALGSRGVSVSRWLAEARRMSQRAGARAGEAAQVGRMLGHSLASGSQVDDDDAPFLMVSGEGDEADFGLMVLEPEEGEVQKEQGQDGNDEGEAAFGLVSGFAPEPAFGLQDEGWAVKVEAPGTEAVEDGEGAAGAEEQAVMKARVRQGLGWEGNQEGWGAAAVLGGRTTLATGIEASQQGAENREVRQQVLAKMAEAHRTPSPAREPPARPMTPPVRPVMMVAPSPSPAAAKPLLPSSPSPSPSSEPPHHHHHNHQASSAAVVAAGGHKRHKMGEERARMAAELAKASERFDEGSLHHPINKGGNLTDVQFGKKFTMLKPSPGFQAAQRRSASPPNLPSKAPSSRKAAPKGFGRADAPRGEARQGMTEGSDEKGPGMEEGSVSRGASVDAQQSLSDPGLRSLDQLVNRLSEAMEPAPITPSAARHTLDSILNALQRRCGTASTSFSMLASYSSKANKASRPLPAQLHDAPLVSLAAFSAAVQDLGLGLDANEVRAAFELAMDQKTASLSLVGLQHVFPGAPKSKPSSTRASLVQQQRVELDRILPHLKQVWTNAAEVYVFFDHREGTSLTRNDFRIGLKRMHLSDVSDEGLMRELDHDRDERVGPREFVRQVASNWHPVGDNTRLLAMLDEARAQRQDIIERLEQWIATRKPVIKRAVIKSAQVEAIVPVGSLARSSTSSETAAHSPSRERDPDAADSPSVRAIRARSLRRKAATDTGSIKVPSPHHHKRHKSDEGLSTPGGSVSIGEDGMGIPGRPLKPEAQGMTPADARQMAALRIKEAKLKREESKSRQQQEQVSMRQRLRDERAQKRLEEEAERPKSAGKASGLRLFRNNSDNPPKVPSWSVPKHPPPSSPTRVSEHRSHQVQSRHAAAPQHTHTDDGGVRIHSANTHSTGGGSLSAETSSPTSPAGGAIRVRSRRSVHWAPEAQTSVAGAGGDEE